MIRVLKRGLQVLECFDLEKPNLSLHEMSLRVGLPKTTTFRILSTLVAEGYVVQLDKYHYGLSHRLMRLGSLSRQSLGLHDMMHPLLERLAAETGETVEVSVLDGDCRICIDVVESASSLKSIVHAGTRLPLAFGATGKMFLAHLAPPEVERIIAGRPESASFDRAVLAGQLAAIRAQGFSLTRDERVPGATAISVPLRDELGVVKYCMTVTGPTGRFAGRDETLLQLALAAAADLSRLLGGGPKVPGSLPGKPVGAQAGGSAGLAVFGPPRLDAAMPNRTPPELAYALPRLTGAGRPLRGLRVLDLTQELGHASKILADLGATVILVEPPGGISARHRGWTGADQAATGSPAHFDSLGAGKCSVVVDFDLSEDRWFFDRLLDDADLVLDDQLQSVWAGRGLDFPTVAARHPNLVWCAVTWFGQAGPDAGDLADAAAVRATGGVAWLAGYHESHPLPADARLALYRAACHAAAASLIGLLRRAKSGGGQFIDVSVQQIREAAAAPEPHFDALEGVSNFHRSENERQAGIGLYPCRDGHVLLYATDTASGAGWTELVDWMASELPEAVRLRDDRWRDDGYKASSEAKAIFAELFARFAAAHDRQDLCDDGQRRDIAIAPASEADLMRPGSAVTAGHFRRPAGQAVGMPSRPGRRPPRLGEHTEKLRLRAAGAGAVR